MNQLKTIFTHVFIAVCLWAIVADLVFAFRHPRMTDTQRTMNIWEVLTFQEVTTETYPVARDDNQA